MVVILMKQVLWNQITASTKNAFYSELLIYAVTANSRPGNPEMKNKPYVTPSGLQNCSFNSSFPDIPTNTVLTMSPRLPQSSSSVYSRCQDGLRATFCKEFKSFMKQGTARCVLQNEPPQHASIMPSYATFSCLMGSPADTAWEGSLHVTPSGSGLLWCNLGSGSELCGCWGGRHAGTLQVLQPKSHLQDAFQGMTVGTSSSKTHSRASTFCLFHRRTSISSVLFVSPV